MNFNQTLFITFFIYGLAFFGMGLAMIMESWRVSTLRERRVLYLLAGFGLLHGIHEWLEACLLQSEALAQTHPAWVEWLMLVFLSAAYLFLVVFALESIRLVARPIPHNLKTIIGLVSVYFLSVVVGLLLSQQNAEFNKEMLEGLVRYMVAVPASVLAAFGLHYLGANLRIRETGLETTLNNAAIGFGMYSFTHLFVAPISTSSVNLINEEKFLALTGMHIEMVWMLIAIWITYSLVDYMKRSERVRQTEFLSTQRERMEALETQQILRRKLLQDTVRAQEEERARIARELHDETAQMLSAFMLELANLQNDKLRKSEMKRTVERLQTLNRAMSQELYRLVHNLRPAQLDDLGLVPALRCLCEDGCRKFKLRLDFEVRGTPRRIEPLVETALFRVAQEALKNLEAHSQVQEGRLEIQYAENEVVLRIIDHGRGFDPAQDFHPPHGWGLLGMQERVDAMGGMLNIDSAPGRGTTIEARVPLEVKETAT